MEPEDGTPLWRLQKLPAERGLQLLHKIIDGLCGQAYPLYQDYHSVWDSAEWNHVLEDITKFFKAVVGKNLSDEEVFQQLNQLNSLHQEAVMKCLKSRKDEIKKTLLEEIVDISSAQLQDFDWQLKSFIGTWNTVTLIDLCFCTTMAECDSCDSDQLAHRTYSTQEKGEAKEGQLNSNWINYPKPVPTSSVCSYIELALSSDKIATLQMPLLNLHLDVKENGEVKTYSVEMNKEELQNLINSLEAANKVVRQLK
ncbi:COMM domain-containing protein 8 isoform X1 [Manis pentadactyla]|uniref:COMM domain-containing protein 8 isoform X1 n=2 Tax=Manis pentadactyla TaxID=143292 RepID=UPI00255CE281|nr:COMM domain-containing protein 8 isoform X1 [Manis pentadactyla]